MTSIWMLTKIYINDKQIGDIFSCEDLRIYVSKHNTEKHRKNIVPLYLWWLTDLGIIVRPTVHKMEYKKIKEVPIKLTTTHVQKIRELSGWKNWFIPPCMDERIRLSMKGAL